ncbi:MAG: hypothetical protein IPO92_18065 [Saprospiraceae bacterium]|nr:hypothetical protein [Saprospiraceae bacterium]
MSSKIHLYMAGDFNIDFGTNDYKDLLELGSSAYELIGVTPHTNNSSQTLDYVLISDRLNNTSNVRFANTKYYFNIKCPPPSKDIPGYNEVTTYGPFNSLKELHDFRNANALPQDGVNGNCVVKTYSVTEGTLPQNVSRPL